MALRGVCGGACGRGPRRHREALGPKKKTEKQHIMAGWSFHPACFYRLKILKAPAPACPSLPHKYRSVRSAGCRGTPKPKPSISKAEKEKSPARPRSLLSGLLFKHGNGFHGHGKRPWRGYPLPGGTGRGSIYVRGTWGKPACPHKCARWPRQTEALRRGWSSCPASVLRSPAPYPAESAP